MYIDTDQPQSPQAKSISKVKNWLGMTVNDMNNFQKQGPVVPDHIKTDPNNTAQFLDWDFDMGELDALLDDHMKRVEEERVRKARMYLLSEELRYLLPEIAEMERRKKEFPMAAEKRRNQTGGPDAGHDSKRRTLGNSEP